MIGKLAGAVLGRRLARSAGLNGLLGAASGIGVSILVHRFVPKLGRALFRDGARLLQRKHTARADDDDTQSAGA